MVLLLATPHNTIDVSVVVVVCVSVDIVMYTGRMRSWNHVFEALHPGILISNRSHNVYLCVAL